MFTNNNAHNNVCTVSGYNVPLHTFLFGTLNLISPSIFPKGKKPRAVEHPNIKATKKYYTGSYNIAFEQHWLGLLSRNIIPIRNSSKQFVIKPKGKQKPLTEALSQSRAPRRLVGSRILSKVMSSGPFNSTPNEEDYLLARYREETNQFTAIEVDSSDEAIDFSVSDLEIAEISFIAGKLDILTKPELTNTKRQRESSAEESTSSVVTHPPIKKVKKVMMAPPEEPDNVTRESKLLVRLVPNIEDVHLFSDKHGQILRRSVFKQLELVKDHKIKFDFCDYERGRFKFVCPNVESKDWAMNIVASLTELWADPKILAVDCGVVPKMIRASVTFPNPAPETLEFFEDIDLKNDTLDTNEWRIYGKKKIQGNKSVFFLGVDEPSVEALRVIGFRPYFATALTKITIDNH